MTDRAAAMSRELSYSSLTLSEVEIITRSSSIIAAEQTFQNSQGLMGETRLETSPDSICASSSIGHRRCLTV